MENIPLISICLISYNQSRFIRQAIEGVLLQKLDFEWELIIADDCSTDGTTQILIEYQKQYPERIKLILQKVNVGPSKNWLDLIAAPIGKYVAYFESDDYWIDPNKLQKQVDYLEQHPEYILSFHNVFELEEGKELVLAKERFRIVSDTYTIMDLAEGNFVHTPSAVYRNIFKNGLPHWFGQSPVGDYVLYMLLSEKGKIKYFPEAMAVYRKNVGIWSGQSQMKMWKRWLTVLDLLKEHFKNHSVITILKKQELNILTEIFMIVDDLEEKLKNLRETPSDLANQVSLKDLLTAIKIKSLNYFKYRLYKKPAESK